MSVFHNNALIGAGGGAAAAADFQIDRSIRLNDDDSAYFNRTPSSAGNRKTWTWSGWVKRSSLSGDNLIFAAGSGLLGGGAHSAILFQSDSKFQVYDYSGSAFAYRFRTTAFFRDPSAWYHLVVAIDTTQSAQADRVKLYINGDLQDSFDQTTYASQNYETYINNSSTAHQIGHSNADTFDGYLAEVNFIDGQALAPTDFGGYDDNNVWQAKEYSGTYGTNGFHLDFSDNSSNAALGTDSSGNSNTWTVNNLDAGAAVANLGFDVITYTGNGSTQTIGGLAFQPDFVWVKNRSRAVNHHVVDSVRGAVSSKVLYPNLNIGEGATNSFSAFTSDGFSVGANSSVNHSGDNLVAWCWKAGGTAASNTDGSITSSVSANPAYGFSIVSFTGDGSGTDTIGHGLNAAPKLIILKDRDNTNDWLVYTDQIDGSWDFLKLNTSDAKSNSSYSAATSSVFSYGTDSTNYIAYCWSEVSGFSKFGSWTGNGSSSGPTVTLGFKPRLVIFKRTDTSGDNWTIFDTARDSGTLNVGIEANTNGAEQSFGNRQIVVSDTGFQVTSTGASSNENGGNYLYAAFADGNSAGIDSLIDTPTNYTASGNNGGNYATLNLLNKGSQITLSNGNLDWAASSTSTAWQTRYGFSTIGVTSGKWYAESTITDVGSNQVYVGVVGDPEAPYGNTSLGYQAHGWGYYSQGNIFWQGGTYQAASTGTFTTGDVIGVALDLDNLTIKFYKNGSLAGTRTGLTAGKTYFFGADSFSNCSQSWNFGQRPFAYTPPSNHLAVCTTNLPDPTIADGSTAIDIDLYTGTNASLERSNFAFSPDFLWFKSRNASRTHVLIDTVRGRAKALESQVNGTEYTSDANRDLVSFDSDGFTVGQTQHFSSVNRSGDSIVAWAWDAGANSSKTYTVKVVSDSGNKYRFDDFGTSAVTLNLEEGSTYVFDQSDSSNSGHPLRFSTTSDGTHNSGSEYTTGVTTTGTPGNAGAKTTIVVAASAPTLYYYCTNHSGMGGQANTNSTAGASNFDGSIQSTVRANASAGISIVGFTGNGSAATIGHGLNAAPELILLKNRQTTQLWYTYHKPLGANKYMYLNQTSGAQSDPGMWNNVEPTSSVFTVGSYALSNNYIAYCFTSVAGFSAFGTYTGNNSTDGPFVHTGFRPAWVMVKGTGSSNTFSWVIVDSKRSTYNPTDHALFPNSSNLENSLPNYGDRDFYIDLLSNGFKIRIDPQSINTDGQEYIYAAFAEHPFKTARAR